VLFAFSSRRNRKRAGSKDRRTEPPAIAGHCNERSDA
jgi:hypothetical protein